MRVQDPNENLLVQRIVRQQGLMIQCAAKDAVKNFASPPVGSSALRDRQWAEQTHDAELVQGAYVSAAESVATLLQTMEEYRLAILALLADSKMLPHPVMSCVRAIHDAALRICSLTDPTISPQERLARSAADFLAKVQGGIPVLHTLEGVMDDGRQDLQRVQEARTGAIDLFRGIGLEVQVKESTGQAQNVRCEGKVANVDVKSTDLSQKYTPLVHFAWGLNSGAAHSNIWLTHGLSGPWAQMLVSMVFPLLDISDALVTNLLGYAGLPSTEIRKATHFRRIILMQRTGVPGPYADFTAYADDQRVP